MGQVVSQLVGAVLEVLLGLFQPTEVKNLMEFCYYTPDVTGGKATVFHRIDDIG